MGMADDHDGDMSNDNSRVGGNVPSSTHWVSSCITGILKKLGDVPSIIILGITWARDEYGSLTRTKYILYWPRDQVPLLAFENSGHGMRLWPWEWVEDVPLSYRQSIYSLLQGTWYSPLVAFPCKHHIWTDTVPTGCVDIALHCRIVSATNTESLCWWWSVFHSTEEAAAMWLCGSNGWSKVI